MRPHVSPALREAVAADADSRCGYCRTPHSYLNVALEVEHLRPFARGGPTARGNLWLSCPTCNSFKSTHLTGVDPATGRRVRLFNPRLQIWERPFAWAGIEIVGGTPTGRATVHTLRLNHPLHLEARAFWVRVSAFLPG